MKILLADDNVDRTRKIIEQLTNKSGMSRDHIIDCRTSADARAVLNTQQIDLLVLDLMLPHRVENDPSLESSLTLLTEIAETNNLNRPGKIVGLTAYDDAKSAATDVFSRHTWNILKSSDMEDGWLETLSGCVSYLELAQRSQDKPGYKIDVLIITALREPELSAVRRLNWNWGPELPFDDSHFVAEGSFISAGRQLSVVSAAPDRMGMVSTAVLATRLFLQYRPRICVMVGICAGIRDKCQIGDVIFADSAWDYQSGKFVVDQKNVSGFEVDPHFVGTDRVISSRIDQLASDSAVMTEIVKGWPSSEVRAPKLYRAPVGSGSAVLADASVTREIIRQQRKVLGIEMELYGLYAAAQQCPKPAPLTFGMKSVCDFADETKADDHQSYSAFVSANLCRVFLERYGREIVEIITP